MKVLDRPVQFITRLGDAFTPKSEADRRAAVKAAVIVLAVLAVIYYLTV